jgi:hypothetical protein
MEPKQKELAIINQPTDSPILGMLQQIVEKGITSENVTALGEMCTLYERVEAKNAEKQFAVAFNDLMGEIPQIKATKVVPNRDGTERYRFAPLEEIDAQLRPLAKKHGLTYFFSEATDSPVDKVTKICTVQHIGGYKRSNPFTVRVSAPPGSSTTQADGSTHTYAKRGALCDAFGIMIEHDDDARMVGKPIGKALAENLKKRVKDCGADEEAFLKYAGAVDYESISDDRFDALDALLARKETGGKA